MSYYIKDTTVGEIVETGNVLEMVSYLEEVCKRFHKKSRASYMDDMISLGHGYDDKNGAYFTERMSEHFDIGVKRTDGSLVRTNIHEHARNVFYRNETGD